MLSQFAEFEELLSTLVAREHSGTSVARTWKLRMAPAPVSYCAFFMLAYFAGDPYYPGAGGVWSQHFITPSALFSRGFDQSKRRHPSTDFEGLRTLCV